jgi:hypothetical protein
LDSNLIHPGLGGLSKLPENAKDQEEGHGPLPPGEGEIKAFVESLPKGLKTE